jgi:hypothetical protein
LALHSRIENNLEGRSSVPALARRGVMNRDPEAGGVAQVIEHLLCKHKALSPILKKKKRNPGGLVGFFNFCV